MIYNITDRSFIILSNVGAFDFLQSMCTCDINRMRTHGLVWGAILTPQGKFLYGFFAFMLQDKIYMEVDSADLMACGQYLSKYALNTNTDFAIGDTIAVYAIWDESPPTIATAYPDPRTDIMGHRVYVFDREICLSTTADKTMYDRLRIQHNVPDLDTDVPRNKAFALELNLDVYNGVDFEKGCYIGQEVTARMHWRQAVKKRLTAITGDGLSSGDTLYDMDKKVCGEVVFVCDVYAMAMVKLHTKPIRTADSVVKVI